MSGIYLKYSLSVRVFEQFGVVYDVANIINTLFARLHVSQEQVSFEDALDLFAIGKMRYWLEPYHWCVVEYDDVWPELAYDNFEKHYNSVQVHYSVRRFVENTRVSARVHSDALIRLPLQVVDTQIAAINTLMKMVSHPLVLEKLTSALELLGQRL